LQDTLLDFKGAVILVTHDRYFLDQVANEILAFPGDGSGEITRFADYLQWETWFRERGLNSDLGGAKPVAAKTAATKTKLTFNEKFELENMEKTIAEVESRLESLQVQSGLPETAANSQKVTELYNEIAELQKRSDSLYARWTELETKTKNLS
jgi:ATP-binding cassette subfamily F protein uup